MLPAVKLERHPEVPLGLSCPVPLVALSLVSQCLATTALKVGVFPIRLPTLARVSHKYERLVVVVSATCQQRLAVVVSPTRPPLVSSQLCQ